MFSYILSNSFNALKRSPARIYGFTLLKTLMVILAYVMGILPIISVPIVLLLDAGMCTVFLDVYNGKEADSKRLLSGFKSAKRVGGGMLWRWLWISIWTISGTIVSFIVPILGVLAAFAFRIVGIYKSYCYSFTPYILMNEENTDPVDALNKSKNMTQGYKGYMFLTDLVLLLVPFVYYLLVALLAVVISEVADFSISGIISRYIFYGRGLGAVSAFGILFLFLILIGVVIVIAANMLRGIAAAGYYNEALRGPSVNAYGPMGDRYGYNRPYGGMNVYQEQRTADMRSVNGAPRRQPEAAMPDPSRRNEPQRPREERRDEDWVNWRGEDQRRQPADHRSAPAGGERRRDNYGGEERGSGNLNGAYRLPNNRPERDNRSRRNDGGHNPPNHGGTIY